MGVEGSLEEQRDSPTSSTRLQESSAPQLRRSTREERGEHPVGIAEEQYEGEKGKHTSDAAVVNGPGQALES